MKLNFLSVLAQCSTETMFAVLVLSSFMGLNVDKNWQSFFYSNLRNKDKTWYNICSVGRHILNEYDCCM